MVHHMVHPVYLNMSRSDWNFQTFDSQDSADFHTPVPFGDESNSNYTEVCTCDVERDVAGDVSGAVRRDARIVTGVLLLRGINGQPTINIGRVFS